MKLETSHGQKILEVAGAGPPLVLIHGGPGMDYSYMMAGLEALGAKYSLHYYEQMPRGEDAIEGRASDQVAELVAICQSLSERIGSLRLVAHSWGAYLAIEAALKLPASTLAAVALLNPLPLTWTRLGEAGERLMNRVDPRDLPFVEEMETEGGEAAGLALINRVAYAYLSPKSVGHVHPRFTRYNPSINASVLYSIEGYDQTQAVTRAFWPQLSIAFGADDYLEPSGVAELVTSARLIKTLDACGHFPFDEAPATLVAFCEAALQGSN